MADQPSTEDLKLQDFRGAGEIKTWRHMFTVLAVLNLCWLFATLKSGQPSLHPVLLGFLSGLLAAYSNRGTQGANERSGSSNALNVAAAELKQATDTIKTLMAMVQSLSAPATVAPSDKGPPPIPTRTIVEKTVTIPAGTKTS